MKYPISIKNIQNAISLQYFASLQDFDLAVHTDHSYIDAKSLIGLYSLIGQPNLMLIAPDDIRPGYIHALISLSKVKP